jgi:uncharacterized RmlC-like cupin family protein
MNAVTAAGDGVVIPGPTGQSMTVKVSGAASRGAYSLIEYSHAPGAPGPPAHLHREHEEAFYVLEGELTLEAGGQLDAGVLAELGRRCDTVFPRLPQGTVTMRNEAR